MATYYPPIPMRWYDGSAYRKRLIGPAWILGSEIGALLRWARTRPHACIRQTFLDAMGYDAETRGRLPTYDRHHVVLRTYAMFCEADAITSIKPGRLRWSLRTYDAPVPAAEDEREAFRPGRILRDDGVDRVVAGFSPDMLTLRFVDGTAYGVDELRERWAAEALIVPPIARAELNRALDALTKVPYVGTGVFASSGPLWSRCHLHACVTIAPNRRDVVLATPEEATHLHVRGGRKHFLLPCHRIEAVATLPVDMARPYAAAPYPGPVAAAANAPPGFPTYLDYAVAVAAFIQQTHAECAPLMRRGRLPPGTSRGIEEIVRRVVARFGPNFYAADGRQHPWGDWQHIANWWPTRHKTVEPIRQLARLLD